MNIIDIALLVMVTANLLLAMENNRMLQGLHRRL